MFRVCLYAALLAAPCLHNPQGVEASLTWTALQVKKARIGPTIP